MKRILLYSLLLLYTGYVHCQAMSDIPAELSKNAYSVVIDNQIEFICESATSAVKKESITITILDEKGKDAALFHAMCDKFSDLRKFSGEILDRTGRSIRKMKKADLKMTEYSSGLTSDDYSYYYDCTGPSYPFTVIFEWEIKYKDGLIMYPIFVPQNAFNQSVVNASYRLYTSPGIPYKYKCINTAVKPEQKQDPKRGNYEEVSFKNLPALESEPYGPSLTMLVPHIYFKPVNFFFDGKEGSSESWESYGSWQSKLMEGRDELPEDFKAKLREMTKDCASEREKVKLLYNYLGKTTRYVSIQLGIGGFQPATALSVHKAGFGDCKGLSNYMLAMLKAIGIPSYYAEISTKQAKFIPDFMSANQTNHVVLQVPLKDETIWLECTNPQVPFGYIHKDIAGHDALLIKKDRGEVFAVTSYPDTLNTQITDATIEILPNGGASMKVKQTSHLFQYEDESGFVNLPPDKQKEYLRRRIKLGKSDIDNINVIELKESNPEINIDFHIKCDQYGSKTGNRLFIPVNVFRDRATLRNKERVHDIYIRYGFVDIDKISIKIPDGYMVESVPKAALIQTEFGMFLSFIQVEEGEINIIHRLQMKTGKYLKESYKEFVDFNKTISNRYGDKIILSNKK